MEFVRRVRVYVRVIDMRRSGGLFFRSDDGYEE